METVNLNEISKDQPLTHLVYYLLNKKNSFYKKKNLSPYFS